MADAKYILEIGRSQELSLLEIEALSSPSNNLEVFGDYVISEEMNDGLKTLGGVIKWFEKISECNSIEDLYEEIYNDLKWREGKVVLAFDWKLKNKKTYSLRVKSILKDKGISSISIIGSKSSKYTSSGAIIQRKVLQKGEHYLVLERGKKLILAKCLQVQDIKNFETKDYKKPIRDMKRGMMPPKLARMLVNIGRGVYMNIQTGDTNNNINKEILIWDPFCGLGSTMFECMDLGINFVGTDIDPKAISGCNKNLEWYKDFVNDTPEILETFAHDAQKHIDIEPNIVCAEGFLGEITTQNKINQNFIDAQKSSLEHLYKNFFGNIANTDSVKVVCFALPYWINKKENTFLSRSIFKALESKFDNLLTGKVLYNRKDSVVGREIVLFRRK